MRCRGPGTVFAVGLAVLLALTPAVTATDLIVTNGTATHELLEDEWHGHKFTLKKGELFEFTMMVTNGSAVDFYIMTTGDYNVYKSQDVTSFESEERNENGETWDHKFAEGGVFYLVVDNVDVSVSGAAPTDNVTYTVEFEVRNKTLLEKIREQILTLAAVAIILALIVGKLMRD